MTENALNCTPRVSQIEQICLGGSSTTSCKASLSTTVAAGVEENSWSRLADRECLCEQAYTSRYKDSDVWVQDVKVHFEMIKS